MTDEWPFASWDAAPNPFWYVSLAISGAPVPPEHLLATLRRYCSADGFAASARYDADRVEINYWDEGACVEDVCAASSAVWRQARTAIGVSDWQLVSLHVVDQASLHRSTSTGSGSVVVMRPGEIQPL